VSRGIVHVVVIVSLALAVFLFRLGVADWRDNPDTHQGQIIEDIMDGRGWVLPLRNGQHIPDKPPLFSWIGAASAALRHSGVDELDARLPSAFAALLCVIATYGFARMLAGGATALWAALVLITTPQFITAARDSRVDMVFSAFLTVALMFAWRLYEGQGRRYEAWLAGLCFGLAVLGKGPLALVLAILVFGIAALIVPTQPGWRALLAPSVLFPAVVLPGLWYVAATFEQGLAFLRVHLLAENASRMAGGQGQWPVWYYIEPLLTLGLPWTLALPGAVRGESALPARARRFLWVWVSVMFIFFSVALGKRRVYILPLRPALAILLAGWLAPWLQRLRGVPGNLSDLAAPNDQSGPEVPRSGERAIDETPTAGPSSLSDVAVHSDQRERAIERAPTAGPREGGVPRAAHLLIGGFVIAGIASLVALRMGLGNFGAAPEQYAYWWRLFLREYITSVVILIVGIGIGAELILYWSWRRRFDLAAFGVVGVLAFGLTLGFSSDAIVRGEAVSFRPLAQRIAAEVAPTQPLAFLGVDDETEIRLLYHLRRHVGAVHPVSNDAPCVAPGPGAYLVAESVWDAHACAADPRWHAIARGGPEISSHRSERLVLARYDAPAS